MSTISTFPDAAPPAAPPVASSQHDARGRFVKGNKGGPGNPLAGKVNRVRNAFLDYFEGPGMQVLCDFLFRKALSGDPRFMRIILQYTVGRLPIDDSFMDAFNAALADAGTAENETGAELDDQIEEGAGDDAPVADGGMHHEPAPNPAGQPAGMGQVSSPPRSEVAVAAPLEASVADLPKRPHSKNRERLLKMLDERDPLRGESSAGPPSTNGLGDARHIPLVGT